MVIETNSAKETFELGRQIGLAAKPGDVIGLRGDLGVGKTVFTQGVAAGLISHFMKGASKSPKKKPTPKT